MLPLPSVAASSWMCWSFQGGNSSSVLTHGSRVPWPSCRADDKTGPCAMAAVLSGGGGGVICFCQQLLHRREQLPWLSSPFPSVSKALRPFSTKSQLLSFGCRNKESRIKKHFMETEFATDFFCLHSVMYLDN